MSIGLVIVCSDNIRIQEARIYLTRSCKFQLIIRLHIHNSTAIQFSVFEQCDLDFTLSSIRQIKEH